MSELDNLASVIRKDWESIPGATKLLALTSGFYIWIANTSKFQTILIFGANLLVFCFYKFLKPAWLRHKYSHKGFSEGDHNIVRVRGIWYLIDHKRKSIRWIANMPTAAEIGFVVEGQQDSDLATSIDNLFPKKETKKYKRKGIIITSGRPGE